MSTPVELYARVVARSLRYLGFGLAAYYAVLAAAHPQFLEGEAGRRMAWIAVGSAVAMAAMGYLAPRFRGIHPPHLALAAMALIVLGNSAAHLIATESLFQSTNFALAVLGGGLLFLLRAYFFVYVALCLLGWWAATAAVGLDSDPQWSHWGFTIGSAAVIATFTLRIRRRMLEEARSLQMSVELAEAARRAEEEKRELQEQVVHAEKLKSLGLLAGGIAHDFNNILVGVLGNASLALDVLDEAHPAHRLILRTRQSAERAAELTRQMLDYSGKGRFVLDSVDLAEEVRTGAELLRASTPGSIELEIDLPDQPVWLEADPAQLRQVALNLVVNAAEALKRSHGRVSVRVGEIEVSESWLSGAQFGSDLPPGPYALLEVADDGPGMSPETLKKIFDPFFTTKDRGRGLGLATVSGIVRSHGGAVRFVSRSSGPASGVTASILFPLCPPPAPEPPSAADSQPAKAVASGDTASRCIVVADDDAVVLELAREVLERQGHRVLAARDGVEAVELVRSREIDLLIVDLTMPRKSGAEAVAELDDYRGAVIVTSGYSEESLPAETRRRITRFLSKPFSAQDLEEMVRQTLA